MNSGERYMLYFHMVWRYLGILGLREIKILEVRVNWDHCGMAIKDLGWD